MPDRTDSGQGRDALDAAITGVQEAERYLDRLRQRDLSKMEGRITNWTPGHHYAEVERANQAVDAARAAVRKAAREIERAEARGEEYTVEKYLGMAIFNAVRLPNTYAPGDRVWVVKVEP